MEGDNILLSMQIGSMLLGAVGDAVTGSDDSRCEQGTVTCMQERADDGF